MAPVVLDTTLAHLYRDHGITDPITVDLYHPYTHIDLHPQIPRETVYVEDEDPQVYGTTELEQERFKRYALAFKTVRAFLMLGPMDVILYQPDNVAENIDGALTAIPEHQRPIVQYINLDGPPMQEQLQHAIQDKQLIFWRPKWWSPKFNCLTECGIHAEINDKRYLLHPGIPTPKMEMVSLIDYATDFRELFTAKALPFVVKLCRCSSAQGTFLVTSEERRGQMLAGLDRYRARGGTEVQFSEFIPSKEPTYGVNFFIGAPSHPNNGANPTFLGATEQGAIADGKWLAGTVDYENQEELRVRFRETILATAASLPESYVGWVCLDCIIDEKTGTPLVVDLNARIAGGIGTLLFSRHFSHLQMGFGRMDTFWYEGETRKVWEVLASEIEAGEVIVSAATQLSEKFNIASLVFGGETREDLDRRGDMIRKELA